MLKNKTVLITGASSGIGEACAKAFAALGAGLVLCARRNQALEQLAADCLKTGSSKVTIGAVDLRDPLAWESFWTNLAEQDQEIDILVNSAGLARGLENFRDNDPRDWEEMIDTNITALLRVTHSVVPGMIHRGRGHIINLGSLAGIAAYPKGAVYCGTKAAVKTITDGIRQDLADTPIRVTNIQPGLVETEFSIVRFHGDKEKADGVYQGIQPLTGKDIADIILYCAQAPAHVQIAEVTVTATHQATGGVVFKKN